MILLFSDYGMRGPYLGQVQAILVAMAPQQKIVNLMADAPRNNPRASAYLLASLVSHIPEETIVFAVVDPGVGSGQDKQVVLEIDKRWYVGPDNGLFDIVVRNARKIECREIHWQKENISNSFHGRDIYAPVCAMIANGQTLPAKIFEWADIRKWQDNLYEIIYLDHFGNAMTGLKATAVHDKAIINIGGTSISYAKTFAAVQPGQAFWYSNSNGLVEIAVNQGSAEVDLKLGIGTRVNVI